MFRKSVLGALVLAAAAATAVLIKTLTDEEADRLTDESDDEIHFIHIDDDEEEIDESEPEIFDASNTSSDVREICAIYPYLSPTFIEDLLKQNDDFNEKYPEETLITINHYVTFPTLKAENAFKKIMEDAGYACDPTDEDMTLVATRKIFTKDGAIVSDILNVANQVAAIKGDYQEYSIS